MPNNFTYTTGIPATNNNPSTDQPNMLINTNSIDSLIQVDHVGFNTNGSGIHKQVRLGNQAAPGIGDGNADLYANNPIAQSWPFWQNANGITYQIIGANANADAATASFAGYGAFGTVESHYNMSAGWTYLPGGMILQYGSVLANSLSSGISPSTIPVAYPVKYTSSNIIVTITAICKAGGTSTSQANTPSVENATVSDTGFTCNW